MKEFLKIILITLLAFVILYFLVSLVKTPESESMLIPDLKNYKRDDLTGVVVVDDSIPSFSGKKLYIWLVESEGSLGGPERLIRSVTIDNFSHEQGKDEATNFSMSSVFNENMYYYVVAVVTEPTGEEELVLVGRCTHQDACLVMSKDNPHVITVRLDPTRPIKVEDTTIKCRLNPHPGRCRAAIPRYYFDKSTNECEEFLWGGCQGVVPFETLDACVAACE